LNRPLTIHGIPDELLAAYGLRRGGATTPSYRSNDPDAVLMPLAEVTGPEHRKLNEDALRSLLRGLRDGAELPPIIVFREPCAASAVLLDGMHRWRLSLALGFAAIPAIQPTRDDAELVSLSSAAGRAALALRLT